MVFQIDPATILAGHHPPLVLWVMGAIANSLQACRAGQPLQPAGPVPAALSGEQRFALALAQGLLTTQQRLMRLGEREPFCETTLLQLVDREFRRDLTERRLLAWLSRLPEPPLLEVTGPEPLERTLKAAIVANRRDLCSRLAQAVEALPVHLGREPTAAEVVALLWATEGAGQEAPEGTAAGGVPRS